MVEMVALVAETNVARALVGAIVAIVARVGGEAVVGSLRARLSRPRSHAPKPNIYRTAIDVWRRLISEKSDV